MKKMLLVSCVVLGLALSVNIALAQSDCETDPGNWIRDPHINQGLNCWSFVIELGAAQFGDDNNALNCRMNVQGDTTDVEAFQPLGQLTSGVNYGFSFTVTASQPCSIVVEVRDVLGEAGRTVRLLYYAGPISTAYGTGFVYWGGLTSAGLVFEYGHLPKDTVVTIDDVSFDVVPTPVRPATWGGIKALYR